MLLTVLTESRTMTVLRWSLLVLGYLTEPTAFRVVESADGEDWRFVLAGIEESRTALKTAEYVISGERNRAFNGREAGTFVVTGAIDRTHARLRQDRDEPAKTLPQGFRHPPGQKAFSYDGPWQDGRRIIKVAQTKDGFFGWVVNQSGYITIRAPEMQLLRGLFDPLALGLYIQTNFESGAMLADVLEEMRQWPAFHVQTKGQDEWVLVQKTGGPHMTWEYELRVDVEHGFTVRRFEVRHQYLEPPRTPRTGYVSEVNWEKFGEVYVPVWHRVTSYDYDPKVPAWITEMNLSWSKINERLDDRTFSADGFDAPDEVGLIDARLGTSVILKPSRWGRPAATIVPEPSRTRLYILVVLSNATLLLGIATFLYLRKRHNQRVSGQAGG